MISVDVGDVDVLRGRILIGEGAQAAGEEVREGAELLVPGVAVVDQLGEEGVGLHVLGERGAVVDEGVALGAVLGLDRAVPAVAEAIDGGGQVPLGIGVPGARARPRLPEEVHVLRGVDPGLVELGE